MQICIAHTNASADKKAVKAFPKELQKSREEDIQQSILSTVTTQDIS
jgi:hypothetical protein